MQNQLVEALLRKDLVLLETTPAVIVGQTIVQQQYAPWRFFEETLRRLYRNYHALFRHFSLLNTWLSFYDQVMTLLPYFVAAPLLFAADPERRITLGTLIQMSNSFEKVFSSLSVVAENWGAVNEFRSVLVRLREFERKLYHGGAPPPPPDGDAATGPAGGRARNVVRRLRPTPRALVSMRDVEAVGPSREATPSEAGSNTELVVVHGAPWERDEDENELPDAHTLSDDEARV